MTSINNANKVLRALFAPAIVLLNRLDYTRKFTLPWLVSLVAVAVAVVVYSLLINLDRGIQPSQMQINDFGTGYSSLS